MTTTTREFPADIVRPLGLHVGDSLHVLEERAGAVIIQITHATAASSATAKKRGSAGAWARAALGIARLDPGKTVDDARMAHYVEQHGQ
jgi:hypothetical protein